MTLDTIGEFVIPIVSLFASLPMMWREEHLWNFSVLQGVHLSNHIDIIINIIISRYNYLTCS
jgi:hypothetical protein